MVEKIIILNIKGSCNCSVMHCGVGDRSGEESKAEQYLQQCLFNLSIVQFVIMKHQHIFINIIAGLHPANNILLLSLLNCM